MKQFNVKISAYINYYNDISFLKLLAESGQFDIYDELVIIDGPYQYCSVFTFGTTECKFLDDDSWGVDFIKQTKIKYIKAVWEDEIAKRVAGYEQCCNELIVLHDSDEFYDFLTSSFINFVESEKAVGFFRCQNLCHDGYFTSSKLVIQEDELPLKGFAFKKSIISALNHLDYLWLVGVKQNKLDQNLLYLSPIAKGYHLTQMRDEQGQQQKFLFYAGLNLTDKTKNFNGHKVIEVLQNNINTGNITVAEAHSIFLRGIQEYTGLPGVDRNVILKKRFVFSDQLENIVNIAISARNRHSNTLIFKLLNGRACNVFIPVDTKSIRINFSEPQRLSAKAIELGLDELVGDSFIPMIIEKDTSVFLSKLNQSIGWLAEFTYRTGKPLCNEDIPIKFEIEIIPAIFN